MDRTSAPQVAKRSILVILLVGMFALTSCATTQDASPTTRAPMTATGPDSVAASVPSPAAPAPAPTGYTDETKYLGTAGPAAGSSADAQSSRPAATAISGVTVVPTSNVSSSITGTAINPGGAVVPAEPTVGATPISAANGSLGTVAGGSNSISTTPAVSVDLAPPAGSSPSSNAAGSSVPATRAERPVTIAAPTSATVAPPAAGSPTSVASSATASSPASGGQVATSGGSGGVSISQRADGTVAVTNATATAPAKPTARQRLRGLFRRRPPATPAPQP